MREVLRGETFWRWLMSSPPWTWLAGALAARVAYVLVLGSRNYQIDEIGFSGAAAAFASSGHIGDAHGPAAAAPLPPIFFGLFFRAFGPDFLYPRLGHAVLGALTAWQVSRLARELSGSERAGRLALALASIYPFFIYYNGVLLSETLYLFFLVPALAWLVRSVDSGGARDAALGGAALALAGLSRPEGAYVAGLIWLGGAALAAARRWPRRALAAAALCWALPIGGWAARNKALFGAWTLDSHGGVSMLHGTLLYELVERQDTSDAMRHLETLPFYREAKRLPPVQRDAALRRAAFAYLREDPARTLRQWAWKFVAFWRFYPRLDKPYHESWASRPDLGLGRGALVAVSLLFEPWLILGGLLGLWRLRRPALLAPALFILGTLGIHVLVVSMMRYRLPVMPLLIAGASAWLAGAGPRQSAKR